LRPEPPLFSTDRRTPAAVGEVGTAAMAYVSGPAEAKFSGM
jgi:hypothetical protein